ncbi:hypothetical protein [Sorangium sp. So ce1389]|uniref:hypothetical protein n=1 Tax=Sorangium sp. So ce1389 TaxID=3133336 RepID=UPI003F5E6520
MPARRSASASVSDTASSADIAVAPSGDVVINFGTAVTRLSPSGALLWSLDTSGLGPVVPGYNPRAVAVDSDGNAIVNPGGWIAKLSPAGDVLWTSGPLGGTSPYGIVDVAVDSEGNAIGVGYYSGGDTFVVKLAP